MERHERLPLGVVMESRPVDHPWKKEDWRPVAVIPGAAFMDPSGAWLLLDEQEGCRRYHAGTLELELFRKETEGYKLNLSQKPPRVFVIARSGSDFESEHSFVPFHVTACPYEAEHYLSSGDDLVEAVPMPVDVAAFVKAFIDTFHEDMPFYKRKRQPHDPRKGGAAGAPRRLARED